MSKEPGLIERIRLRLPRKRWALRKKLLRKPPKGDIYYGDMVAYYDMERAEKKRWHREHAAVEAFLQELPTGLSVLDVPVGTGRFLELYKQREHRVTGFDASHEMLAETKRRAGSIGMEITVDKGDATTLPYESGQFDLVVSTRFLRHVLPLEQAKQSLREMARVTSNHAIIELGYNELGSKWPSPGKPMRELVGEDDLVAMIQDSGLQIVAREYARPPTRKKRRCRAVFLLRKT